ncbi:MAG: cytochrome ubiquinol oxidase subunit I, partial [Planctomycetia bacterium]
MHYPWWYVPHATAPMLIALIAVVHVLVSHYAVGGGIFLAVETHHAHKKKDKLYLSYLRRHARFFVLLTVAFGAITGVGIWWTIGLTSPLATEVLIRTFVFGWAIEWVFFVIEVTSAFIFYYYWGKLSDRVHTTIGYIYAIAAWISLVLITAITGFMLNSGNWMNDQDFWVAFLNPQFIPQTILRTGGALLLTALYVYFHASLVLKKKEELELRTKIARRSVFPALLGAAMILVGSAYWFLQLPPSAVETIQASAVLNIFMAVVAGLSAIIFLAILIGPLRYPEWLSPGFAGLLLLLGLGAVATGEFVREAIRKPYIVYNVVLGNQIMADEVQDFQKDGYLQSGTWTRALVHKNYPEVVDEKTGRIVSERLLSLPEEDRLELGHTIFMYHCNDCHAESLGYSAAVPL